MTWQGTSCQKAEISKQAKNFYWSKESLLTQELLVKGDKGLQRKVGISTSVSTAVFVKELEVFAASF